MQKNPKVTTFLSFLKEYGTHFKEVGSVMPDSEGCRKAILESVPFESAEIILEYGSASGRITQEIIRRKDPSTALFCFEKNKNFYENLRGHIEGKNVTLLNEDAFDSVSVLTARTGIRDRGVDCIVSTLPCSSLNFEDLVKFSVLPLLNEKGVFIQYMHVVSYLKGFNLGRILKRHFTRTSSKLVMLNVPPTLIYTCQGKKRRGG